VHALFLSSVLLCGANYLQGKNFEFSIHKLRTGNSGCMHCSVWLCGEYFAYVFVRACVYVCVRVCVRVLCVTYPVHVVRCV